MNDFVIHIYLGDGDFLDFKLLIDNGILIEDIYNHPEIIDKMQKNGFVFKDNGKITVTKELQNKLEFFEEHMTTLESRTAENFSRQILLDFRPEGQGTEAIGVMDKDQISEEGSYINHDDNANILVMNTSIFQEDKEVLAGFLAHEQDHAVHNDYKYDITDPDRWQENSSL